MDIAGLFPADDRNRYLLFLQGKEYFRLLHFRETGQFVADYRHSFCHHHRGVGDSGNGRTKPEGGMGCCLVFDECVGRFVCTGYHRAKGQPPWTLYTSRDDPQFLREEGRADSRLHDPLRLAGHYRRSDYCGSESSLRIGHHELFGECVAVRCCFHPVHPARRTKKHSEK